MDKSRQKHQACHCNLPQVSVKKKCGFVVRNGGPESLADIKAAQSTLLSLQPHDDLPHFPLALARPGRQLRRLLRPQSRTLRHQHLHKLDVRGAVHGSVIQRGAVLHIKLVDARPALEETLGRLSVDRLRTVMDRAETRLVGRVDVGAVAGEEADRVRDVGHPGFVGVDFAGAEGEVQHTAAFAVGGMDVVCGEELSKDVYLPLLTC
jgi:hypothetical protein